MDGVNTLAGPDVYAEPDFEQPMATSPEQIAGVAQVNGGVNVYVAAIILASLLVLVGLRALGFQAMLGFKVNV